MPLREVDLKNVDTYRKAVKRDAARLVGGDKVKFWIFKNVVLPNAAGKPQKPTLLVALVNINEIKLLPEIKGKKIICRGNCSLLDAHVSFEAEEGVVPYGRLKVSVPLLMGKPLLIPKGVTLEDEGLAMETEGEGGDTVPTAPPLPPGPTSAKTGSLPTAPTLSAKDLQAAMNKLTPQIKAATEAHPDKKASILEPVAAFAQLIKSNTLDQAGQKLTEVAALLKSLGTAVAETIADAAKANFEKQFAPLKVRADKAKTADATLAGITGPLKALTDALKAVTDKETAKDYAGATALLADLDAKIIVVENLVTASAAAKKTADDEWKALNADIKKADATYPSTPTLKNLVTAYNTPRNNFATKYTAKDYVAAVAFIEPMKTGMKALLKAAADNDKVAGPKATAAEKGVKDLVKGKKLEGKSNAEKVQLLKDLRGPSTKMTPEFRAAQREVYKTLKLDPAFVKEDKKKRKEIVKALVPSKAEKAEFKDKRKNWSKQTDAQKIAMIKKAVDAQSKILGIPSPEIKAVNDPPKGGLITNGYFNPEDGKIYINLNAASSVNDFEKAIDLAFHENSHNYQNELVKKLENGTLKKTDPAYEEALLFQANDGPQAYVDGAEDFATYKKQPLEEHAHQNGPETAKAFMKAIK